MSVLPDFLSPDPPVEEVLSDELLDDVDALELSSAFVDEEDDEELELDELLLRLSVL